MEANFIMNPGYIPMAKTQELKQHRPSETKEQAVHEALLKLKKDQDLQKLESAEAKVPTAVPEFDMEEFQNMYGNKYGTNPVFTPEAEKENFFQENKKTLIILGAVLVVAIVGLFIYSRTKS